MPRSREAQKIIEVAERFLGLYEVKSNAAWDDPSTSGEDPQAKILSELMQELGWQPGWAYCQAFAGAVLKQAYIELCAKQAVIDEILSNMTPSVMKSFANWRNNDVISTVASDGAVFFMQKGQTGYGHAGIVVRSSNDGNCISTIEGNTNPNPGSIEADREGDGIFRRIRQVSFAPTNGLWMRGFLNPIEIPLQIRPDHYDLQVHGHTFIPAVPYEGPSIAQRNKKSTCAKISSLFRRLKPW